MSLNRRALLRSGAVVVGLVAVSDLATLTATASRSDTIWARVRGAQRDAVELELAGGRAVTVRLDALDARSHRDGQPGIRDFRLGDEVVVEIRDGQVALSLQSSYRAFRGEVQTVGAWLVTTGGRARLDGRTRVGGRFGAAALSSLRPGQRVVVNAFLDGSNSELIARGIAVED